MCTQKHQIVPILSFDFFSLISIAFLSSILCVQADDNGDDDDNNVNIFNLNRKFDVFK